MRVPATRRRRRQARWARAGLASLVIGLSPMGAASSPALAAAAPGSVTTVVGNGTAGPGGDGGPAADAELEPPHAVAVAGGTSPVLYVAAGDSVRKVTSSPAGPWSSGTITTVLAGLGHPGGLAVGGDGSLYIADTNRSRILRIDPAGKSSVFAGTGVAGFAGDGRPAAEARLDHPLGVAVDSAGNLYIADTDSNRLRKVDASGTITTVAGSGGTVFGGDGGPAVAAALGSPSGVAVDAAGNVFVTDVNTVVRMTTDPDSQLPSNFVARVRRVSPAGVITTVAGGGSADPGDGGPATSARLSFPVSGPAGVAVDGQGDLVVADGGHHRIRRVDASGTITTLAGTGTSGFAGDGGPAAAALFASPAGVAVDAGGRVLVADTGNNRVRLVEAPPSGELTVRIDDADVAEGDGGETPATFTVRLAQPAVVAVTVEFATADGTARAADGDYTTSTGTVTFAPGERVRRVAVPVLGDRRPEPIETFFVNLANASGAVIADAQAVGTIVNDDGEVPIVSVGDATVVEGDGGTVAAEFGASLSRPSPEAVTVAYATISSSDGAEQSADYVAASGSLRFEPGVTQATVGVAVTGDLIDEVDEQFSLVLANPTGAVLGQGTGRGTILDDDGLWRSTLPMAVRRTEPTATVLDVSACPQGSDPPCGDVLVLGGVTVEGTVDALVDPATTERYSQATGRWTKAAPMPEPRVAHTATLLRGSACAPRCGMVLVAGGNVVSPNRDAQKRVALFDPVDDTWEKAAPLQVARDGHTATLLANGDVLVVGGERGEKALGQEEAVPARPERYVARAGVWRAAGSPGTNRRAHTATLLYGPACRAAVPPAYCGMVLVAGGSGGPPGSAASTATSAELYDPATNTWQPTGTLATPRVDHTATLLAGPACDAPAAPGYCGKVLVVGGSGASAELYDPATGTFSAAGALRERRTGHVAVQFGGASCGDASAVACGSVLVAGGTHRGATSGAEVYDPSAGPTGSWVVTESMSSARSAAAAALLGDGSVLVAGGRSGGGGALASAERYVPTAARGAGQVVAIEPSSGPTFGGTEVTIRGRGLLAPTRVSFGGVPAEWARAVSDTEIVALSPPQPQGPVDVTVTTAAGSTGPAADAVFTYGSGAWSGTGAMATARVNHVAVTLDGTTCADPSPPGYCGRVLVAGATPGNGQFTGTEEPPDTSREGTAEYYDPVRGVFAPTGRMSVERAADPTVYAPFTATLLDGPTAACGDDCGKVLVTGGIGLYPYFRLPLECEPNVPGQPVKPPAVGPCPGPGERPTLRSAELYDPVTGTWELTDDMATPRVGHTATLLHDGTVLVAGGATDADPNVPPLTPKAEVYDPTQPRGQKWRTVAPMGAARVLQTASLLPSGEVLVAGGAGDPNAAGFEALSTAELYAPSTGKWRPASSLAVRRFSHTATVLRGPGCGAGCGKVVVAGGAGTSAGDLDSVELYDPGTGTWSAAGRLQVSRVNHSAVVLPTGKVLIAGGLHLGSASTSTEVFDPSAPPARRTAITSALASPRAAHSATLLEGPACRGAPPAAFCGTVLVTGGDDPNGPDSSGFNVRSSAEAYTAAPEVMAVSASAGPSRGGTSVMITGTGFAGTSAVHFSGRAADSIVMRSSSELAAVTPPHPAGPVTVAVENAGGTSATNAANPSYPFRFELSQPPGRVTDLRAEAVSETAVTLTWSAPPSDGPFPPAADRYAVKQSTASPIANDATFAAAGSLCDGVCELSAPAVSDRVTLAVTGLRPATTYHYALRAVNDIGNGPLSNAGSVTTGGVRPLPAPPAGLSAPPRAVRPTRSAPATTVPPTAAPPTSTPVTLPPSPITPNVVAESAAPPRLEQGTAHQPRWLLAAEALGAVVLGLSGYRWSRRRRLGV